ncbi:MAG: hypothetical protein ACLFTK_16320 [Anaerolineales bacterium]
MLDTRTFIITAWLTFFAGTLGSTLTFNYFANTPAIPEVPDSLADTTGLWLSLWLGGFAAALLCMLLGWHGGLFQAASTSALGYSAAALLRLVFLGAFLPVEANNWDFFFGLLAFDLAPYPTFVLLVMVGGALATALGAVLGYLLLIILKLPSGAAPDVQPHPRFLGGVTGLLLISMLLLVLPNAFLEMADVTDNISDEAAGAVPIIVPNTHWLVLARFNMAFATLYGLLVGLVGTSIQGRAAAALTLWLAGSAHVLLLLPLEEVLVGYDPLYAGLNPNRVDLLSFIGLWLGTPLVGAAAAFALHNLRMAFSVPPPQRDDYGPAT